MICFSGSVPTSEQCLNADGFDARVFVPNPSYLYSEIRRIDTSTVDDDCLNVETTPLPIVFYIIIKRFLIYIFCLQF